MVKIPLPAAGQASVHIVTLKLRITKGKRALKITTLNDARLPAGIRAVAGVVIPTRSATRRVNYKVYVLINNLGGPRRLAESIDNDLDFRANLNGAVIVGISTAVFNGNCTALNIVGTAADGDTRQMGQFIQWGLAALRRQEEQSSDPESVLDHVIYNLCQNSGAEVPEDGSG